MEVSAWTPESELSPGTQIGRYEVIELLATGGMAEIYLVKSVGLEGFETRSVLKRLPPSSLIDEPGHVKMFLDEARLVGSLRHPNIAQVFDIGEDAGSYYFVMEYLDGSNLRELLDICTRRSAPMPLEHAIQIVLGIAEGLHAAHKAVGPGGEALDIVHRDVSPNNVVITADGAVKLIDFGVAKASTHRARTETGVVKGKFAYMSPEQCSAAPLDRRTDLFALGVVLFELTTGARPHGKPCGPELLYRIVEEDCPDPRLVAFDYPEELANIVNKLLHRDPERRYQSARELHRDLSLFAVQHRMLLSPYDLASWMQSMTQPVVRAGTLMLASVTARSSTRAHTVPLGRRDPSAPLLDEPGSARLARGTGTNRDMRMALPARDGQRRLTSLPYMELAIGSSDAMGPDRTTEADEADVPSNVSSETTSEATAKPPRGRRSPRRRLAIAFCATTLVSAAAVAGYLQFARGELGGVVAFVAQLAQ